ncbi:serine/arginine repetitive matrix protein 1-like [Xiphophorus maculatus]|uniref:serine/arginine repetitive matrix protein 1-like n=1 Tax=Xiphophorus maculatus TaxID=8083 RepID=UPI000C6D842E|nr:serine/arginine repetitive matrix protein 1-like [Xiphophorus maculatus]
MSDFESDPLPDTPVASPEAPGPSNPALVRRSVRLASRPNLPSPASILRSKGIALTPGLRSSQIASLAALLPSSESSPSPSAGSPPPSVTGKRSCKSSAPPAKRRRGRPPSSQPALRSQEPLLPPDPGPSFQASDPTLEAPGPSSGLRSPSSPPPDQTHLLASALVTSMDTLQRSISSLSTLLHKASDASTPPTAPSTSACVSPQFNSQPPAPTFTLASAHSAPPLGMPYTPQCAHISSRLRSKILQGQYINLASILLPSPEVDQCVASSENFSAILKTSDPRLSRDLSIGQFLAAFSVFRDVICSVYPDRRVELDAYLALIADLHMRYGRSLFYQYHKAFATKAAAVLFRSGQCLNWSILDMEILIMLTQSTLCFQCGSIGHQSAFCPSLPFKPSTSAASLPQPLLSTGQQDRYGRKVQVFNNMPVCNNFNESVCAFPNCAFLHVCSLCRDAHPKSVCPRRPFPTRSRRGSRN